MAARTVRAGRAFVEIFADDAALVKGLRRAQARLKAFGGVVQNMGQSLLKLGAAAAAPLALSTKVFASFESQMSRVLALSQATDEEFKRLEKTAKDLGASTVFSASQAAEAMGFFALAGFKTDQIITAMKPTLDLAAAGQLEIAAAADIAAKLMRGMGISADEVGSAVDVMAKAMTTSNTDLMQLGDAFKFVGPIAKKAGTQFEEVTAAIQLLSNAGIQGEMAGTTLRGMLLSLTSPGAAAASELKKLGVQVNDSEGNVRSLTEIIGQLERALSGMGTGKQLEALGTIFPARTAAGVAELVTQGGNALAEATAALGDSAGTAGRIAKTQLDNIRGDFVLLLSALQGVAIEIGASFSDMVRTSTKSIQLVLSALVEWVRENKGVVRAVVAATTAILSLGGALFVGGLAIKVLAASLGGLAILLTSIGALASMLSGAFLALFTPLALIVGAIGGVVAGFALLAHWFVTTTQAGRQMTVALASAFQALAAWAGRLRDVALQAFRGIVDALNSGDIALAGSIAMTALGVAFLKGTNAITVRWIKFKGMVIEAMTEIRFSIVRIWTEMIGALQKKWQEFAGTFTTTFDTLKTQIENIGKTAEQRLGSDIALMMRELNRRKAGQGVQEALDVALSLSLEGIRSEESAELEKRRAATEKELQMQELTLQHAQTMLDALTSAARRAGEEEQKAAEQSKKAEEALANAATAAADEFGGSAGAFNAFQALRIGAVSGPDRDRTQEKILDEEEEQTRLLTRINDKPGAVFS